MYFNEKCMPVQHSGNVQVFSASLDQKLNLGILHWDNKITYQTASDESVIPMPNLSVYSNLYLSFKIAKVLDVQLGVDCDYYTKYKGLGYQPATMTFYNQNEIEEQMNINKNEIIKKDNLIIDPDCGMRMLESEISKGKLDILKEIKLEGI